MWEIFSAIISKEIIRNNRYKWLNSIELLDDVYNEMINWSYYWYFDWFDGLEWFESLDCAEVKELLVNFWKELEKKRQPNWQSILKHFYWCKEYACKYLEKHGFLLYDKWGVEYIEKWDINIPSVCIQAVIDKLSSHYYVINNMIKLFPSWLRIQLIKMVYVNEQISLQDENVCWLISKLDTSEDEEGKGKKTIRERIRDALSHHTYILLEWVDNIILRDWYDKKTDSWSREATFSLSKLFENTFKEIEKNSNSIVSSFPFLLESLNLPNT